MELDILTKFKEVELSLAEARAFYRRAKFVECGVMLDQAYEELGELLGAVDEEVG